MGKKILCIAEPRQIPQEKMVAVTKKLREEISQALGDGFGIFQAALNSGVGLTSARLIAELRDT